MRNGWFHTGLLLAILLPTTAWSQENAPLLEVRPVRPGLVSHLGLLTLRVADMSVPRVIQSADELSFQTEIEALLEMGLRFADLGDLSTTRALMARIAQLAAKSDTVRSDYESDPDDGRVRASVMAESALAALSDRLGDDAETKAHLARIPALAAKAPDDVYSDDFVQAFATMRDYTGLQTEAAALAAPAKGYRSAGAQKELLLRRAAYLASGGDEDAAVKLIEGAPVRSSLPEDVVNFTAEDGLRALSLSVKWAALRGKTAFVEALVPRAIAIAAGPGVKDPRVPGGPYGSYAMTVSSDWAPALIAAGKPGLARAAFDEDLRAQAPFPEGEDGKPECTFFADLQIAEPAAWREDYRAVTRDLYASLAKAYPACIDANGADGDASAKRLETLVWTAPERLVSEIDAGGSNGPLATANIEEFAQMPAPRFAALVQSLDAGNWDVFDALVMQSGSGGTTIEGIRATTQPLIWALNFASASYRPYLRDLNLWPVAGFHSGL